MGLCMWKMQSPVINIQKSKNYPYVYMTLQAKYFTFFLRKNLKSAKVIKLAFDFSEGNTKKYHFERSW